MNKYITNAELSKKLKKNNAEFKNYSARAILLKESIDEILSISGGQVLEKEDQLNFEYIQEQYVKVTKKLAVIVEKKMFLDFVQKYRKYSEN